MKNKKLLIQTSDISVNSFEDSHEISDEILLSKAEKLIGCSTQTQ